MSPYYKLLSSGSNPILPLDNELLAKMEGKNKQELESFDKKLTEAEKMEGETEIAEILRNKAFYLTRIGEQVRV